MIAFDGENIWVSTDAIMTGSGHTDTSTVGQASFIPAGNRLNRRVLAYATYTALRRTLHSTQIWASRGLAVPQDDTEWLHGQLRSLLEPTQSGKSTESSSALVLACDFGRLEEASAMLRAGAVPIMCDLTSPSPLLSKRTRAAREFETELSRAIDTYSTPRACLARAYSAIVRISPDFRTFITTAPLEVEKALALCIAGDTDEVLSESASEARPLWEAHVAHLAHRRAIQGQPETVIMPQDEHAQEHADHHTT